MFERVWVRFFVIPTAPTFPIIGIHTGSSDLGFTYYIAKNGTLLINHNGALATTLRGKRALEFIDKVQPLTFPEQQQLMARVTGNYKRGNERQSRNHPKHKR